MPTQAILTMLKQKRVEHYEFAWCQGLDRWVRLCEIPEFSADLPAYPKVQFPGSESAVEASIHQHSSKAEPVKAEPVKVEPTSEEPPKAPPPAPAAAPKPKDWPKVRRAVRMPVKGKVEVEKEGSFDVLNVSEGGVFVKAKAPLEMGTELRFKLKLEDIEKAFDMTGVVIREGEGEGQKGFAIEFTRLNPAHRRAIVELIVELTVNGVKPM
jgi:uncharacterized protein (TIGR02266 family)